MAAAASHKRELTLVEYSEQEGMVEGDERGGNS